MNQFVPIFLGQKAPSVSQWARAVPGRDTRAADTQKCIRAGGKHNDLEDVGFDTYHHTFFEMLGNWSFGDYFKAEAIAWAWELITEVWKFPPARLYATVYQPGPGDPSVFDQEAHDVWARLFTAAGLDPRVHIRTGGRKDNFWMMGDTGPCGPCSELHIDLTPQGDTGGALVNTGSAQCIEIWNLVFIQFNANPDGTFSPLPARHVDTGMGFERVAGILQNTRGFTDFSRVISNYETDIFRPLFDQLERLSGRRYRSTLPRPDGQGHLAATTEQERADVAFRVIADHVRTLGFAIADGIQPGNTDRNYVLRRILRRAVRYGRSLGFHEPFFYKLVPVLADSFGDVFPEIRARQAHVQEVIRLEEEAFNKTLDAGLDVFEQISRFITAVQDATEPIARDLAKAPRLIGTTWLGHDAGRRLLAFPESHIRRFGSNLQAEFASLARKQAELAPLLDASVEAEWNATALALKGAAERVPAHARLVSGNAAFLLYDTYGFPLDLTELMARERGLTVDTAGFDRLMAEQRALSRAAQKREVVELSQVETTVPTQFVGYDTLETPARVLEVVRLKDQTAVILDTSACYAEMGGQVGDTGELSHGGQLWRIVNTQKMGDTWLHLLDVPSPENAADLDLPTLGSQVVLTVDRSRRQAIQRHHSVTHLLHWALHEVVSPNATQKGSFVGPDKLTFDFNHAPLTPDQLADVERLVNERILDNAPITWVEAKYNHVKDRHDVMQLFGEKYGDWVRVVQIGGRPTHLDGYSIELCGGTHCHATGEIGLFRVVAENAIAAGVRRIEAIAGLESWRRTTEERALLRAVAGRVNAPITELEKRLENLLAQQKDLEKQIRALAQKQAATQARELLARATSLRGVPSIIENLGVADGDALQGLVNELKGQFEGLIVLGGIAEGAVTLVAAVTPAYTSRVQAGKIISQIAPVVGGRGGGRPDNARGGGKEVDRLPDALEKARTLVQ